MKKLLCLLACVLLLSSCAEREATEPIFGEECDPAMDELFTFAGDEEFTATLTQGGLQKLLTKYSYGGVPLIERASGTFWDGEDECGWFAGDEIFFASNRQQDGIYSNTLILRAPVDGFTLPRGITFADPLSTVLEKLGIPLTKDAYPPDGGTVTLSNADGRSLMLTANNPRLNSEIRPRYLLTFKEKTPPAVTRRIEIGFLGEDLGIAYVTISVSQMN